MNEPGVRRTLPAQSSGSGHTFDTARHPGLIDRIPSKRVCFYKSGDPQFSGLRMVINSRTFKSFDALMDSLSKKVPLPFGVRNITTPRGVHGISCLDELEDGKSYICSDSRKVKPFNLALARRKLPPWYHARPVSSHRRTLQQARLFPSRRSTHWQEPLFLRTPKRLVVFRNGEPSVKYTVVLRKKTAPNYESILERISELLQFHVIKLHTPDGRRVDGLPGLILCSGTVVAVGREPFRPAAYNAEISPAPVRRHTNRRATRRQKAFKPKKKTSFQTSPSGNFSASSERFIVHRIHSSIAESSCELPSNYTNSVELDSNCVLESIAEMEADPCDGDVGQSGSLANDDNIEKSFRVNQDGSMTVEMKVRLTIKEEETVQWTTTLSRSAAADQLSTAGLPDSEAEQQVCTAKPNAQNSQSPDGSSDTHHKDKPEDHSDDEPPSLGNGAFTNSCDGEEDFKNHAGVVLPKRTQTPGHKRRIKQRVSEERGGYETAEDNEETTGSYFYQELTENRTTEELYTFKQSSTKPVPKPRRLSSVDNKGREVRANKSNGMTETLQAESSGDEVTETILHIYEQQTCQDNYLANTHAHGIPVSGSAFGPPTSDAKQRGSNTESEHDPWRSSSTSLTPTLHLKSKKTSTVQERNSNNHQKSSHVITHQREVRKDLTASSKSELIKKQVRLIVTPRKRKKKSHVKRAEKRKRLKPFSSAVFIKRIYGNKSKSPKNLKKIKTKNRELTEKNLSKIDYPGRTVYVDSKTGFSIKENLTEHLTSDANLEFSHTRAALTRQTSLHTEKISKKESTHINKTVPHLISSSSATKEYVENWLDVASLDLKSKNDQGGQRAERGPLPQTETGQQEKRREVLYTEESLEPQSENIRASSVKLRVQSFENKLSSSVEKTTVTQQMTHHRVSSLPNPGHCNSQNTKNARVKLLSNAVCFETIPQATESLGQLVAEVEFSAMAATELPPPPPELLNSEHFETEIPSAASSPLYRLSSTSSEQSNYPSCQSPPPQKTSPVTDRTENPAQHGAEMSRTPSIKRAPLISNQSLERKMSLRKAGLDKYTVSNDAGLETTTISSCGKTAKDEETTEAESQQPVSHLGTPSFCTSVSPESFPSDERMSSASIPSSRASISSNVTPRQTKMATISPKDKQSPKTLLKKEKKASPSPERKLTSKKSSELQNISPKLLPPTSRSPDRKHFPSAGTERHATHIVSPSLEKKMSKTRAIQRTSPHSQSLDMMSPPITNKSSKKKLSRNRSWDNLTESKSKSRKKTVAQSKSQQKTPARKPTHRPEDDANDKLVLKANQDQTAKDQQAMPKPSQHSEVFQPLNTTKQPNMKPVLEKICYSIKSIKQITQNKRKSCLEKSNSLPDFSSHVASTFGSSSKALLAFLAVMTLREGLTNLNVDEFNANNVSCAEALKMIDSLREIANIEDSHTLKATLSHLQQSASKQLLESWKGFQEFGESCRSESSTPKASEAAFTSHSDSEQEGSVIDKIIDNLDIPEILKEELVSLSDGPKIESNSGGKISSKMADGTEFLRNENSDGNTNRLTGASFCNDEENNMDAKTTLSTFNDTNQPKVPEMEEIVFKDCLYYASPKEMQLPSKTSVCLTLGSDIINKGSERKPGGGQDSVKMKQEPEYVNGITSKEAKPLKVEQYVDCKQCMKQNKEENRINLDKKQAQSKKAQKSSSVTSDTKENKTDRHFSEEEEAFQEIKQEKRNDSSKHESPSKEEKASPNCYVDLSVREEKLLQTTERESFSEEEGAKAGCKKSACRMGSMGLSLSADSSTAGSDTEDTCSEDERPAAADGRKLQVIAEESLSGNEEEYKDEPIKNCSNSEEQPKKKGELEVLREETEEEEAGSEDEAYDADKLKSQISPHTGLSNLIENHDLCGKKDGSVLIFSESLGKGFGLDADKDSGNDHSSCDEHLEELKREEERISSSLEEELSYYDKESNSDEEHAKKDRCQDRSHLKLQEAPVTTQPKGTIGAVVGNPTKQSEYIQTQSVAERVILLERQVADAQKANQPNSSTFKRFPQRKATVESESPPSESPTSEITLCTRSAPQSSLSFSYDSTGVITAEPEGSRVRSIRDMFLAKSASDIQQGRFPSPSSSELSELRADTSGSGGYQSQTLSEPCSSEDDSARKSIKKGFVRRTIEMLYGKKDTKPEEARESAPSEPNRSNNEAAGIFSPFHAVRNKAMSELSYFNSSTALDVFSDATRCIAFNAQVGPGDSVPIDTRQWLLRENTSMRKSISDPVGINKSFTSTPLDLGLCKDPEEKTPYSLFSIKPEEEQQTKPTPSKCTYFSLPHASESEVCQDETIKNEGSSVEVKEASDEPRSWAERNGVLSSLGAPDFKMKDNKVHPLPAPPAGGEVVLVQPGKGQAVVSRRVNEPDVLDILYNFCGEHCPIL